MFLLPFLKLLSDKRKHKETSPRSHRKHKEGPRNQNLNFWVWVHSTVNKENDNNLFYLLYDIQCTFLSLNNVCFGQGIMMKLGRIAASYESLPTTASACVILVPNCLNERGKVCHRLQSLPLCTFLMKPMQMGYDLESKVSVDIIFHKAFHFLTGTAYLNGVFW